MTASSRGTSSLIRSSRICSTCLKSITRPSVRRSYSAAAPAVVASSGTSTASDKSPPSPHPKKEYIIKSGILLSRPPLVTKKLSPFEKAFFFYQKRLNERLVMPFTRYFYFKKNTTADTDWKIKAKERNLQPARELGGYNAYSDVGWNDELLVGDKLSETETMVEALVKDAEVRAVEGKDGKAVVVEGAEQELHEGGHVDRPLSRWTDADRAKDTKRLDRKLERTLYLCVKRKDGGWGFPAGPVIAKESLHQAAERVLVQTAGLNMNTWLVGHAPIGHYITLPRREKDSSLLKVGEKTFFMKARIMAGQADIKENIYGMEDFKWLTKQEVEKHVGLKYYSWIKNMLADR